MATTFKDFFEQYFSRLDQKYVDMTMHKNLLQEMAVPMDVSKYPIKPDHDDIEFLHQFPTKYWTQALHLRYSDDLADALEVRQKQRRPVEEKLRRLLYQSLLSGQYNALHGKISEELFRQLNNKGYGHVEGNEKLAEKAAIKLAELETEKQIPHTTWPNGLDRDVPDGYKKYVFKKTHRSHDTETIVARPFINRLIHKLERTRNHEHHPDSELPKMGQTHGLYGYDLYDLQRGNGKVSHATRGMKLPNAKQIANRVSDYLAHNAHGMYGDINVQGDDIVWKPVGEGRVTYKDNWAWKKIYQKLFPRIVGQLKTAEPGTFELDDGTRVPPEGNFQTASEERAAAHKLTMQEIFKMIESGQIKGPPIPGVAPQGLPVKIKIVNGKKTIDAPPLYLPHKKNQKIRFDTPAGIKTRKEDVPLIKPAEYLRLLGIEEDDDEIDPSQLRGHAKDYVAVSHDDYKKSKGYVASGSFHFMQNSFGRMHLDPSDPEYAKRKAKIEQEMGLTGLNKNNQPAGNGQGQYFKDIILGIWNCIKNACGGMTNHEVEIMRENIHDLHQMVYQRMMMNLRDESLNSAAGRRKFAKNVVSSWAQQDLGKGGGTRRLRKLTGDREESLDAGAEGSDGGNMSTRDAIQQRMVDREKQTNMGRGSRVLPAGQHQFSYQIDNLRNVLKELATSANEIDNDRESAIRLSHEEISDQIAELIGDAITDKAVFVFQLQYYLQQLFMLKGYPKNEAEHLAAERTQQYGSGQASAKAIIKAFQQDQEVQQILQGGGNQGSAQQQLSMAQQDALDRLNTMLDAIQQGNRLNDPTAQGHIYNYINSDNVPEDARALLKAEADKRFGKTVAAPTATPKQTGSTNNQKYKFSVRHKQELEQLIKDKKYLEIADNDFFLAHAPADHIQNLISKLQTVQASVADPVDKQDYVIAIHELQKLLRTKSVVPNFTEMTSAIYNGENPQQRDYNWWGSPQTAGMSQQQAKRHMEKNIVKTKRTKI